MKKTLILISIILLLHFIPKPGYTDSIEVSGVVSGIWNVDTVNVIGDIELREVENLTIEPGVLVLYQGEFSFRVNGCLEAIGNQDFPINFNMADTTGFSNDTISDGGWKGIRLENIPSNVDSSIFNHCIFSFGKAMNTDSTYNYSGAICVRNTDKIRISNCVFQNNFAYYNGGAVFLESSDALVENNTFANNDAGYGWNYFGYGGAVCADYGESVIRNNYFYQNTSAGIAGALCIRFNDCPVFNNIFESNFSSLAGGFGILHVDTCKHIIANNLVINNGAAFFGAGIGTFNCSPTYINNTITNNHCIGGGGGFYCKDSVVPNLYNNIIYGNTHYGGEINQVYLWDLLAQPNFYFNDIEGGKDSFAGTGGVAFSGDYENNIDMDPEFAESGDHFYALNDDSPCIDAGTQDIIGFVLPETDIAGNPRVFGDEVDIGAYENQSPVFIDEVPQTLDAVLYSPSPNPASTHVDVSFYLIKNTFVEVSIFDQNGKKILMLSQQEFQTGSNTVRWNLNDENGMQVRSGIYICKFRFGNKSDSKKILVTSGI